MNVAAPTDVGRGTTWIAGLAVGVGASVATAHGLYQVAAAAHVPAPIAWLYPLITDGLAIVAYSATSRLHDGGRRYAAAIVILAAGLSGLAQAVYLAGGMNADAVAPHGLRFGVGAWPAIAAALAAHLIHLIGSESSSPVESRSTVNPSKPASSDSVQTPVPTSRTASSVQTAVDQSLDAASTPSPSQRPAQPAGPARERARNAARLHHDKKGALPTVTELARLAGTSRGTAATALKDLRADRRPLHVVSSTPTDPGDN
jgi:hypothetical protein